MRPPAGREEFTGTPNGDAPSLLNASYTFVAEVEIPPGGGNGMFATQGGRFGGYGFRFRNEAMQEFDSLRIY